MERTDVARSSAGEQHLPLGQLSKVALTCETECTPMEKEIGMRLGEHCDGPNINRIYVAERF